MALVRSRENFAQTLGLILISLGVVYLIGNASVPLWDRDEPRYAQTSRQMLRSGDWVVPRFLDEVRTAKPIFIYWCQAVVMRMLGDTDLAARVPSVIGMLGTVAMVGVVIGRTVGRAVGIWSALILGTSALAIAAGKMCLTDAVLLLFITAAQLCFFRVCMERRLSWGGAVVMGVTIGLAGLTKGPVVLGVMGITLLALGGMRLVERWSQAAPAAVEQPREIRVSGTSLLKVMAILSITAAICLPWLILIHQREPNFLPTIIGHDVVTRVRTGLEGHKGPPGYYLLTVWLTYLPWSFLLPMTVRYAWRRRDVPVVRFAMAAVLGPWLMFEIVQTKLPHYLLPTFPALAFLTSHMLIEGGKALRPAVWMGVGMLAAVAIAYGLVLPRIEALRISPRVAQVLVENGATKPGDVIMIDYKEPSLAFYQGGTIRPQRDNAYLNLTPPEQWPRWIVLTADIWKNTPAEVRAGLEVIATVHGWAYADGGRVVDVMVLRKRD